MKKEILKFYLKQGSRTEISKGIVSNFPDDMPSIVKAIQNMLIHKVRATDEELVKNIKDPACQLKTNRQIFEMVKGKDLSKDIKEKVVCICRNYTMMLVAVLREKGIPARSRCGFGIYFAGGNYEDHWIAEYWSYEKERWVQVDAQMDEYWIKRLDLNNPVFNPLNLKKGQFLYGSNVWEGYRQGVIDGEICGFRPENKFGEDFIRGNLMRDFFALNKIEYLYNEGLPLLDENPTQKDLQKMDYIAQLTKDADKNFEDIQTVFQELTQGR